MNKVKIFLFMVFLFVFCSFSEAGTFRQNVQYTVCFTPEQNCTDEIVAIIDKAKESIYLQAYSFTSRPIIAALIRAKQRGVKVFAILDRSEFTGQYYSPVQTFIDHHIPVWSDDSSVDIAHNKVLIIDRSIVETGSFNFTTAAQRYNAENVLIIYDDLLAGKYLANWQHRQSLSQAENPP